MATKTITTTITLVDPEGEHAPGDPVTLEAKEADGILLRFGGEEVSNAKLPKGGKKTDGQGQPDMGSDSQAGQ